MPSPSSDPVAELAELRERLRAADEAHAALASQCRHLLALVGELQSKVRQLEERLRDARG